jgi:predicted metal-binding protein
MLASLPGFHVILKPKYYPNVHYNSGWKMRRVDVICKDQFEEDLERFAKLAVRMGAVDAKVIEAKDVVVQDWVRLKCQYGCGNYGKSLTCPPYSPAPDQMRHVLSGYSYAILMRLPDESMTTHDLVARLERHAFLAGYYSAWGIGAGPCERCTECNLEHCVFPRLARPSMESCGIDVYATARKNEFHIEVLKTRRQKPTYFGLLLVK